MTSATGSSTIVTDPEVKPLRSLTRMVLQPKPTWPDPLDSLGDEWRPMRQHMKKKRRWAAIGPAANAFLEICDELKNLKEVRDDLEELESKAWPWGWSFCMAGRSPDNAKPYIVVHCESRSCCVRILQVIENEAWWKRFHDKYPSIGFVIDKKAPRPLLLLGTAPFSKDSIDEPYWFCCHCKKLKKLRHKDDLVRVSYADRIKTCLECLKPKCKNCKTEDLNADGIIYELSTSKPPQGDLMKSFEFEGRQIELEAKGRGVSRCSKATIGGVLIVGGCPYGLTAAHPFSPLAETPIIAQLEETEDDCDDAEFLSDSDESEVEEALVEATSRGSVSSEEISGSVVTIVSGEQFLESGSQVEEPQNIEKGSSPGISSTALKPSLSHPQLKPVTIDRETYLKSAMDSADLDWALIPLQTLIQASNCSYSLLEACEEANLGDRPFSRASRVARPPFSSREVITTTASVGKINGRIDTTPFIMRPEGSAKLVKTYRVRLEQDISPGDCGSWVVDAERNLYGHIIAGQPGCMTAFIVPAADVLSDIVMSSRSAVRFCHDYLPWVLQHVTKKASLVGEHRYNAGDTVETTVLSLEC